VPNKLGLGGGEFVVAQDVLLMQGGELVQLVDHRRRRRRGGCLLVWRRWPWLFEGAEALVSLLLLLFPPRAT
jgi:hypothetical protein